MRKFGRLKEKIKEVYRTQKAFADAIGINVATLNAKLNSKAKWDLEEIEKACDLLDISNDDMMSYFFY